MTIVLIILAVIFVGIICEVAGKSKEELEAEHEAAVKKGKRKYIKAIEKANAKNIEYVKKHFGAPDDVDAETAQQMLDTKYAELMRNNEKIQKERNKLIKKIVFK